MQYLKRHAPRITVLALLCVSAGYVWPTASIPLAFWSESARFNARSMPYLAGGAACVVALLLRIWPGARPSLEAYDIALPRPGTRAFGSLTLISLMFLYPPGLEWLGFPLATTVFLSAAFRVMGERHWRRGIAVAVALAGCFWFAMNALGIHLEPAPWFLRGVVGD